MMKEFVISVIILFAFATITIIAMIVGTLMIIKSFSKKKKGAIIFFFTHSIFFENNTQPKIPQ